MRLILTSLILSFFIADVAAASQVDGLCVSKEIKKGTTAEAVVANVAKPYTAKQVADLYAVVKTFTDGWQTPTEFWPTNAVTVDVKENGVSVCQVNFYGDYVYVLASDNSGFVVRKLYPNEYAKLLDWTAHP